MNTFKTVPITLITGYLGSGKTTLINHILSNTSNYKVAVIVNDIGEVNIDADLIEKGGIVNSSDESLVALQNGCICCTLKKDLLKQLTDLVNQNKFDHILIEASGICEPIPIAQTICYMQEEFRKRNLPEYYRLDSIISVTDALRLRDEFNCGAVLETTTRGEEDIENLVIQQIEFCNLIILNKTNEISKEELNKVKQTIKVLQPSAKIIETNYCNVKMDDILDTFSFDFQEAITSSGWQQEFDDRSNEHDDEDEHEHHHEREEHEHHEHHHHHHEHGIEENDDEGTADEYDIGTFVYFRRKPFNRAKFLDWCDIDQGRNIIRTKGVCYFEDDFDTVLLYEQAGRQKSLSEYGKWYCANISEKELKNMLETNPQFKEDYDPTYGDRIVKLVFIGQNIDKAKIKKELDNI